MSVTTIKMSKKTKSALEQLKQPKESYDHVISRLVNLVQNKDRKRQLIEGYKAHGARDTQILKEWEPTSNEL
jgi:predicted CopG family antitoxin